MEDPSKIFGDSGPKDSDEPRPRKQRRIEPVVVSANTRSPEEIDEADARAARRPANWFGTPTLPVHAARLRVLSWNIQTLGKKYAHRSEAVIRAFAEILLRSSADIMALIEVMEGSSYTVIKIVDALRMQQRRNWMVRFPTDFTGTGGFNGRETYAVIYDADLYAVDQIELVGEEIPYHSVKRTASQSVRVVYEPNEKKEKEEAEEEEEEEEAEDAPATHFTRRPCQATIRPLHTNPVSENCETFPLLIFHSPHVAAHDFELGALAIKALEKVLTIGRGPNLVLCADLNLDEEGGQLLPARDKQAFSPMDPRQNGKQREDAEVDVLAALDAAFAPLARTGLYSNLEYNEEFATTMRASIFPALKVSKEDKYYENTIGIFDLTCSNYDQVLVRAPEQSTPLDWSPGPAEVIHLLGAVMPQGERTQSAVDFVTQPEPSRSRNLLSEEVHDELLGTGFLKPDAPDDPTAARFVVDPLETSLAALHHDRDVIAAALRTAARWFRDRSRYKGGDGKVVKRDDAAKEEQKNAERDKAALHAANPDPVRSFFDDPEVWTGTDGHLHAPRKTTQAINPGGDQEYKFFRACYFLAIANLLSDHMPVVVTITIPRPNRPVIWPSDGAPLLLPNLVQPSPLLPQTALPCDSLQTGVPVELCQNIGNCRLSCCEGTSLPASDGCITGAELVRLGLEVVGAWLDRYNLDLTPLPVPWIVNGGGSWLMVAGWMLRAKDRNTSFARKSFSDEADYFSRCKHVHIGNEDTIQIDIAPESQAYHPRVMFEDPGGESPDWSYRKIAEYFGERQLAHALLKGIRNAEFPDLLPADKKACAALLVTLLMVEANKDNLCFLTAPLALECVGMGMLRFAEVFLEYDTTNAKGLCGRLGLFPLASTDGANFKGRHQLLHTGQVGEAAVMESVLDSHWLSKDWVMTKKDMLLLTMWCAQSLPQHRSMSVSELRPAVVNAFRDAMGNAYG